MPDRMVGNLIPDEKSKSQGPNCKVVSVKPCINVTSSRELVLLSWILVLLRNSEDESVSFEWIHQIRSTAGKQWSDQRLLESAKVLRNLETITVEDALDSIAQDLTASKEISLESPCGQEDDPYTELSCVLSTGSLCTDALDMTAKYQVHIEVHVSPGSPTIRILWMSDAVPEYYASHLVTSLRDIMSECLSSPLALLKNLMGPVECDLSDIWAWNGALPATYDFCMHDLISRQAQRLGDKVAIDAWDGTLTYHEVDTYSTYIAQRLHQDGARIDQFIPVCFEKSKWTIVAVLAVMKVGGTFVMMDPSIPVARLQNMASQTHASTGICSRSQLELLQRVVNDKRHIVIDAETFADAEQFQSASSLPSVPTSTLMYLIFTSGSTGTPKGVKISHRTYTSSAIPRAEAVGYMDDSRVLDFASYAFDVSIDSMLLTLGNGGCLCIPSDEDRMNDINNVMRQMRITYAGLTPSVARILEDDVIQSLTALGLGGEAASARDVNEWGKVTRIVIGYGPCECTIGCTINRDTASGRDYITVGEGNGACIWIADPDNHDLLVPVGAVGELLVEGPIVGQGYLNDPEKTAVSFVHDPPWLVAGHGPHKGRGGRLYKTGDLGKYDPAGSGGIVFAGRKDTQVKLRGQRVELGEIESQLLAKLPTDATVIAEVITPSPVGSQAVLVAFVTFHSTAGDGHSDISAVRLSQELRKALHDADDDIRKLLPRYMIPTAYIPVNHIPRLVSGKTDRRSLRNFGATVDLRELDDSWQIMSDAFTPSPTPRLLNDAEQRLRSSWASVLMMEPEVISSSSNFFALGGDSLKAMRLIANCRAEGLDLSVMDAFRNPVLSDMSSAVKSWTKPEAESLPPFPMIKRDIGKARLEASQACSVDVEDVEDIYPCTPTQESLFTFSIKAEEAYVAQRVARIPSHITIDEWQSAWNETIASSPILRTRVAQLEEPGLQQVVVHEKVNWRLAANLSSYLEDDRKQRMEPGHNLARYAIVNDIQTSACYMVWTVHHVLYDGWSEPIVLQEVSDRLMSREIAARPRMKHFVNFINKIDQKAMVDYWRSELEGAIGPQFPRLPSRDFLAKPDKVIDHQVFLRGTASLPFTMATLIRGAWALVASQYSSSDDVVFGETLTGRDISMSGVETVIGPLIATVPVRIQLDRSSTVVDYLQTVQQSSLARTPYQHMGMQNIRKVSRDAQSACEAGTGLVIQPETQYSGDDIGFGEGNAVKEALHFNPYPVMIAFGMRRDGFSISASFDTRIVRTSQMKRVLHQVESTCSRLIKDISTKLSDISCLSESELNQIWKWNHSPPLALDASAARFKADQNVSSGSQYPRAAIPWVCDPRNSMLLSPIKCIGELFLETNAVPYPDVIDPPWLVAGSQTCLGRSGKLQATGDLVELEENGDITFVRAKSSPRDFPGLHTDYTDVENYCSQHLPPSCHVAVTNYPDVKSTHGTGNLIIFVHEELNDASKALSLAEVTDALELYQSQIALADKISIELLSALKRLNKSIQDDPSFYVVSLVFAIIQRWPLEDGSLKRDKLDGFAQSLPRSVLLCHGQQVQKLWRSLPGSDDSTPEVEVLRSSWSAILSVPTSDIDVDDNFFRLGGDSVLAMKLVSALRQQGHGLSVADIFQNMRLCDAAKALRLGAAATPTACNYERFSLLDHKSTGGAISTMVKSLIGNDTVQLKDAYPVTSSQALDIAATVSRPRTSVQYTMLFFDTTVNPESLTEACERLMLEHDILRTVFVLHESRYYQAVLETSSNVISTVECIEPIEQFALAFCDSDVEDDVQLGELFTKMVVVKGSERCGLIIRLSHAQYDGHSLPRMLQDLRRFYEGKALAPHQAMSVYLNQEPKLQQKAIEYWRRLLHDASMSALIGRVPGKAQFEFRPIDLAQKPKDMTTATLLTATWALVLARRLQCSDVTFGSITSGRNVDGKFLEEIVGPCYQFTPVRVKFQEGWTNLDLMRFIQEQGSQSANFDFLGYDQISKNCTSWSLQDLFFDSVVHHQDWDDADSMNFGDSICKFAISNPHGDAAQPFKVVTFVRDGQMHIGVVGGSGDTVFINTVLEELVVVIQELSANHDKMVEV